MLKLLRRYYNRRHNDTSIQLVPEHNLLENEYTRPWMADWALAEAKMMSREARSKYNQAYQGHKVVLYS